MREYPSTPAIQSVLSHQAGYTAFTARYGGQWEVQFDELLGTPVWIRGSGIPLIPDYRTATKAQVIAIAQQFVRDNAELFKATPQELKVTYADYFKHIWVVYFERQHDGVPVIGSNVELVFKFGRLLLMNGESYPEQNLAVPSTVVEKAARNARLSWQDASRIAHGTLGLPVGRTLGQRLVVFPVPGKNLMAYKLAWEVDLFKGPKNGQPGYRYIAYVDAVSGSVIEIQDGHRYQFSGNVSSMIDTRTVGDPIISVPNELNLVTVGANTTFADAAGNWNIAGSGSSTITLDLQGSHTNVNNQAGADMVITHGVTAGTPSNDNFAAAAEFELAQTDTYYGMQTTNTAIRTVFTTNNWLNSTVVGARVNISSTCNAYWNGSTVNFFRAGGGCNNTGRIFDVVAHELGHGIDQNVGGAGDGGLGEFIGDAMAFHQTDSPDIGPFFLTGGAPVRRLQPGPNRLTCYSASTSEVHDRGQMLGIVVWDIREAMKAAGVSGQNLTDRMWVPIATSQTLTSWYNGLLVADDDDGNVANGTPNGCLIWQMYDEHSGPSGAQCATGFNFTRWPTVPTTPVVCTSQNNPPIADFTATPRSGGAPLAVNFTDGSANTPTSWAWTFGDGGTANTQNPSHTYTAPGSYDVTLVATNAQGSDTETKVAYINVGSQTPFECESFDTGAAGWTHTGDPGADEWQNGAPGGLGGDGSQGADPTSAVSAPNVYGTDLNLNDGNYVQADPDPGPLVAQLDSPAYDCTGYTGVQLTFQRWLAVEDGVYDQAEILVNGTQVYVNPAGDNDDHTIDTAWTPQIIDISAIADNNPSVQITFRISSDQLLAFGGWNIDDLCLEGIGGGSGGTTEEIVTGAGVSNQNPPVVKTWSHAATPAVVATWTAYSASDWGVNVASVDVRGGGVYEVVTAPGPGPNYGPQVRGFDPTGAPIAKINFFAYGTLKYGSNIGGGNVDGDAHGEMLTAAGPGEVFGPHIRGWNFDNSVLSAIAKINFFAYSTLRYGARVAGGDLDADGNAEIVTGAGAGIIFAPHVRAFNYDNGPLTQIANLFAFGSGQFGAAVAAGNVDADPREEIIASHGPDPNSDGAAVGFNYDPALSANFNVVAYSSLGGAEVSAGDLDGDGTDELIVGAGWGAANASTVRTFTISGGSGTQTSSYTAYAGQSYGTKVSIGDTGTL